jgi:hypothetical protein
MGFNSPFKGLNGMFQELNSVCDFILDNAVAAREEIGERRTARQITL